MHMNQNLRRFRIRPISRCLGLLAWAALLLILPCAPALALHPTEIALVCNKRVPASMQLARFYAQARDIPETHIFELTLPDGETMPAQQFDWDVIMPLRQQMTERKLRPQIKCLVSFYGVPLKLTPRQNSESESAELGNLRQQRLGAVAEIKSAVEGLEQQIASADAKFKPDPGEDVASLTRRADTALARGAAILQKSSDSTVRQAVFSAMLNSVQQLSGLGGIVERTKPSDETSPEGQQWRDMQNRVESARLEILELHGRRHVAESRQKLREMVKQYAGLIAYERLLNLQIDYLEPDAISSFDSELSLLWVDAYQRKQWLTNPLHYASKSRFASPVLMVTRLDGPQSGTARDIVLSAKAAESNGGLRGAFAIDSRGLSPRNGEGKPDGYGTFDQRLRDLADLIRGNTQLPLVADDTDKVFQPGTVDDVALYCGWYAVRNYTPAFKFNPGAVGYHVASFEAISLRSASEKGWVRGLLNDSIAATLGPVDEPYLFSFPDPVDFFALLLTGRYTLAETYWMTCPVISWKMSLIGDPLYNPFARKPALQFEQLPENLRKSLPPG